MRYPFYDQKSNMISSGKKNLMKSRTCLSLWYPQLLCSESTLGSFLRRVKLEEQEREGRESAWRRLVMQWELTSGFFFDTDSSL